MVIEMRKKSYHKDEGRAGHSTAQDILCFFLNMLTSLKISILKNLMIFAVISGLFSVSLILPVS